MKLLARHWYEGFSISSVPWMLNWFFYSNRCHRDHDMILRRRFEIFDGQNNIIFVDLNAYFVNYLRYYRMGCHGHERLDSNSRKNFKLTLQRHDGSEIRVENDVFRNLGNMHGNRWAIIVFPKLINSFVHSSVTLPFSSPLQ